MSIESLEHMVRSRVRMFLRHTWLVTILGTAALAAALWVAFYFTTEADHMRIAAGTVDAKFVQSLTNQIAKGHHDLSLQVVQTRNSAETAQAISKGEADLAVLPSNLEDSVNWPVVAIVRQNVMALIVPPGTAKSKGGDNGAVAATAAKATKSAGSKSAAASKPAKAAKSAKSVKSSDGDDSDTSDDSSDSAKFGKVDSTFRQARRHRHRQ